MSLRICPTGILWVVLCASACGRTMPSARSSVPLSRGESQPPLDVATEADAAIQVGYATWYGRGFVGRKMANGQRFDPAAMTAAHRTIALGTWVDVTRRDTGRSVRVRITDRGPFGDPTRIIDLSKGAAERLDMIRMGVAPVEVRMVTPP